jgi:cephalosporin-C deacetylase
MPQVDLSLDELERYRPDVPEPDDFDEFWAASLAEAAEHELAAEFVPTDAGLPLVEVLDVTFAGFAGQPVKGWLVLPAHLERPLACVVEFVGYGNGRGLPHQHLFWAAAGFAHFVMDARGQGSQWGVSDTADVPGSAAPHHPGFLTLGVRDPVTYYYRRLMVDAARAVAAARAHPAVRTDAVLLRGGSQGGGLTLAAAALAPEVAGAMIDEPFLCHFRRAVDIATTGPYLEIGRYLSVHRGDVDTVFRTLSYVDGVAFARRATAPALFSVALQDTTCPPSTVYAAYHAYAGPTELRVWPFNDHEGGKEHHQREQLAFARSLVRS